MKYCFVINDAAGNGKSQKEIEGFVFGADGRPDASDIEIYRTTGRNDAESYVAALPAKDGPYTVFACGGDGTFREVVNGVMKRADGCDITVGIVPCGTGNDFVRAFTYPEAFSDIEKQFQAHTETIDVLKVDGDYCINLANLGFDANVADRMTRYKKRFGGFAYTAALIRELFSSLKYSFKMEFDDGEARDGEFLLVSAANGMAYGGGYFAAPLSNMRDGVIDVCYCDRVGRMKFISTVGDYKAGRHFDSDKYSSFLHRKTVRSMTITSSSPLAIAQDGEIFHVTKTTISVVPSALKLAVPDGCDFRNK